MLNCDISPNKIVIIGRKKHCHCHLKDPIEELSQNDIIAIPI